VFDEIRRQPRTALAVLLLPALLAGVYLLLVMRLTLAENDGYIGALLDDTWIHVRFADHIAQGKGLSYNDGVVTPGATSPLWVLLLASIYAVTGPGIDGQIQTAVALSALGHILAVLAVTGFGWWATRRPWVGLLAGIITALTGRFVWMGLSGMEITTFTALCVLALWSHVHDLRQGRTFGWRTGILAALATLARPEGYLLAALIGLDAFVFVPLREGLLTYTLRQFWRRVRPGWRGALAYALLAGSYPLACLLMSGHPLPNTFRVKSRLGEMPDLPYSFFWTPNTDHGPLLIVLAMLGMVYLLWRALADRDRVGLAWTLWPAAFVLGVLFLGPDRYVVNNARYVAPAIPFHALLAALGILALNLLAGRYLTMIPRWLRGGAVPAALALALIGGALWLGRGQGAQVANDVAQLRRMHIAAAHWLIDHTAPEQIIALNDVGAIVHITDRRVLDLMGLVSPEVIAALENEPPSRSVCAHDLQLARLMLRERPALVGVFPWFFPCLTAWEGALQPFNVFTISGPTVIAGGELVIYWPVWESWPVQAEIPPSAQPLDADFEQGITLAAYEAHAEDDGLRAVLWWQAHGQPRGDYTVFVHLINERGDILGQLDSRPQNGQFQTQWWRPGDIIRDERLISIEDGALPQGEPLALRVGLYPTGGGPRLPRFTAPAGQNDFAIAPLDLAGE
jgi:hypothetical protein